MPIALALFSIFMFFCLGYYIGSIDRDRTIVGGGRPPADGMPRQESVSQPRGQQRPGTWRK